MIKNYEKLKNLFGCYFHQDWDFDYQEPEKALKAYVFGTEVNSIILVLKEIENLKNENFDLITLDSIINRLGCEYYYQSDNMNSKEWIDYIYNVIKAYLFEKQKLGLQSNDENKQNI